MTEDWRTDPEWAPTASQLRIAIGKDDPVVRACKIAGPRCARALVRAVSGWGSNSEWLRVTVGGAVRDGQHTAAAVGPPGTGKSSMVMEFIAIMFVANPDIFTVDIYSSQNVAQSSLEDCMH